MHLTKTSKAWDAIARRPCLLTPRQRALLLLANGQRSLPQLEALMGGSMKTLALELTASGYLTDTPAATPSPEDPPALLEPVRHGTTMAAARMCLLDLSERFFARTQPEKAAELRTRLRDATSLAHLADIARLVVAHIRVGFGAERAERVRLRLSTLLPWDAMAPKFGAA